MTYPQDLNILDKLAALKSGKRFASKIYKIESQYPGNAKWSSFNEDDQQDLDTLTVYISRIAHALGVPEYAIHKYAKGESTAKEVWSMKANPMPRRMTMKHDANFWREECNYISKVTDKKGRVKEMNNSTGTFRRYCEMQRDQAEREGFYDAATYIQECLDDLPAGNPTPRIPARKVRTQPSQLTGDAPSKRLIKRRKATAAQPMPGVWANPLTRVTVTSESQRPHKSTTTGRETKAPDSRLRTRRKTTEKAPEGFYANPIGGERAWLIVDPSTNKVWARAYTSTAAKNVAQMFADKFKKKFGIVRE